MEHAEKAVLRGKGDSEDGARDLVGIAHHSITRQSEEEGEDILGSSTICVGVMRPGGVVEIANLGDSGFRVLRGSEIVFASEVCAVLCFAVTLAPLLLVTLLVYGSLRWLQVD